MIKTFLTTLRKNNVRFGGVSLLYLLLAAVIAAASVATFAMTGAIGQEAQAGSTEGIWRLLALLSGIVAVHAVCALVAALVLGRFGGRVGYSFRQNFAKYFLHLPFKKFQEGSSGDRLSVFSNDVPAAVQFITQGGLMFASSIFSLVASFIFMFMTNVTYTLIFYATFPVLMVLQVLLSLPIQKTSKRNQELLGEFNNTVNDSLQNIPTITAYGLEEVMEKRYLEKYENFMKAQRKHGRTFLPLVMFGILASVAPIGIVMVTTATSVINGYMYVGEYIAFLVIAMMSAEWLMMLAQNLNGAQTLRASATRLNEMTPDVGTHTLVRPSSDSISFESVNFTYGEGEEAVQVIKD
ncbi:MAG: ABC transporter ATP-binding protein/permease, partial [Defluviitaleaceae bacterium]|nr:ABC transporter ATP-binding protein/permease [Defluviitaleaceae bacterium]